MMTRDEMMSTVTRLMLAKRSHDIEGLLAIYSEDCVLEQPSLGVRSVGHPAIRPGLEMFARAFPDYERSFEGSGIDGSQLISWGTARMTLTGSFAGQSPNGQRASVMTFVIFRFNEQGQISYEGHHWDLASLCRQSGISVEAVLKQSAQHGS